MKNLLMFCTLSPILLLSGCGASESSTKIRALTPADCQAISAKVEKLSQNYMPPEKGTDDLLDSLLVGNKIPHELLYLKPQAVRVGKNYATIYLYKTPAGEDSIHVLRGDDETWTIETHEGSWINKSKVIWSSTQETTQLSQPTPSGDG